MTCKPIIKVALAGCAGLIVAGATPMPAAADTVPLDNISKEQLSKLTVLEVDRNRYVIVGRDKNNDRHGFYGDAKQQYRMRLTSGSKGPTYLSFGFWAPGWRHSQVSMKDNVWHVRCGDKKKPLKVVTGAVANKILTKASFRKRRWQREPVYLARDNRGTYYYVDALRKRVRQRQVGFRLFVGKKGAPKQIKLVDVVNDTRGSVFLGKKIRFNVDKVYKVLDPNRRATSGNIKVSKDAYVGPARKQGGEKKLRWLKADDNVKLIYHELGVYDGEPIGVPCEDL